MHLAGPRAPCHCRECRGRGLGGRDAGIPCASWLGCPERGAPPTATPHPTPALAVPPALEAVGGGTSPDSSEEAELLEPAPRDLMPTIV